MSHWKPMPLNDLEVKTPWTRFQHWAKSKQEVLAVSVIFILLLVVGIPYYLKSREQAERDAVQKLSVAQYYLNAQVDAKNGPFKSETEKYQAALQQFQQVTQQGAGTGAAKVAQYYVGKCQLILNQYPSAYVSFDEASQRLKGTPLGEAAWVGKATALVLQQKWNDAASEMEKCLVQYPDGFLAPTVRMNLSDTYLKAGQKDKALKLLQQVVKDKPNSDEGREASRVLKTLQS
jgi:predicted negative regulator of RcsB-dependent stress response